MDKELLKQMRDTLEKILPTDEIDKLTEELSKEIKNKDRTSSKSIVNMIDIDKNGIEIAGQNPKRKGLYIYNSSNYPVYIKLGKEVSEISFTILLESGAYFELAQPIYTGIIEGMGEIGQIMITELT